MSVAPPDVPDADVERLAARLARDAKAEGLRLGPDAELVRCIVRGLLANERRYGYRACPCRLADGDREADRDIVCPCDYRDADIAEHGACYCGLYAAAGPGPTPSPAVPERRPPPSRRGRAAAGPGPRPATPSGLPLPVWRCRVCGYLCAREAPPGSCPICKASSDRFERFM